MPIPLLTTKLYAPPRRLDMVSRPRLLQKLNHGLHHGHRLTLVSAPAGFGKTTLVSAWLFEKDEDTRSGLKDESKEPKKNLHSASRLSLSHPFKAAWLSLDAGDNDPVRFLTYLVATLQQEVDSLGQSIQDILASPPLPPLETLITVLVNDLTTVAGSVVLVLDDYHVISAEAIHRAVQFLIEHQPPNFHLVLTTRADPPLSLARWRVCYQITEIRVDDLRFTLAETQDFLTSTMGLDISQEAVSVLEKRTEGWVAGLQLAALSMQGWDMPHIAEFVATFSGSHRYVIDYLLDEVMRRQPDHIREFLYQTAILDRLSAPLCDTLLRKDREASGRLNTEKEVSSEPSSFILEHLDRTNLFLVPLDDQREWYRYHHLFADFLRNSLRQEPGRVAELHRRAAEWHAQRGLPEAAIGHALAAHDFELAAGLIERALYNTAPWLNGQITTVMGWIKALPESMLYARPHLGLFASRILLLSGQFEVAERIMQETEQGLRQMATSEAQNLLALAASYRTVHYAVRGDVVQAVQTGQQALNQLPPDNLFALARTRHGLGVAYQVAGNVLEAVQAYQQAAALAKAAGNRLLEIYTLSDLAQAQMMQGQLSAAAQTCELAWQAGQVSGVTIPGAGFPQIVLADIARERNDLQTAERLVTEGLRLIKDGGIVTVWWIGFVVLSRVKLARGDFGGALAALAEAGQVLQRYAVPRLIRLVAAHRARVWLAQGQQDLVAQWAQAYSTDPTGYLREVEELMLARILTAQGQPARALLLLEVMLTDAESTGRMGSQIEILVLRALALQAQNDRPGALLALGRAMELAAPEGYVRTFVDEGLRLKELLGWMEEHEVGGWRKEYIQSLLRVFQNGEVQELQPRQPDRQSSTRSVHPSLTEPLSEQELNVLRLLANGLSNQEIADRLIISLGTAKWHVHNLHSKLGVKSRTQAVTRARELGLI